MPEIKIILFTVDYIEGKMFKNYFKIAFRKMMQQKMHSFINIGGLALGIASFLLISVYVHHEMNYDTFHSNHKNIYRITRIENDPSGRIHAASTPHALPKALVNDFPLLENVVSIVSNREDELKAGENVFKEKILFASPNFFETYDFPFLTGSKENLSNNLYAIVISDRLAKKLFGETSPLGQKITIHGQFDFTVAAVMKNVPTNSSFQFDAFVSNEVIYRFIWPDEDKKWYAMGVETYVEFGNDFTPAMLQAQFPAFLKKYLPDYLQGRMELNLQPLRDIHNNTEIISHKFPPVSMKMLVVLFLIACFILAIASINFINLTTVRQTERQKEVGVLKVVGASRWQLVQQFLCESVLMTGSAVILGYAFLQLMLPWFNRYIQRPLDSALFQSSFFLVFMLGFGLILGLFNGLYPALILSIDKPADIFRKKQHNIFSHFQLRHLLVTVQFAITVALIFSVLSVSRQIFFMKNHNLGFHSENLIAIPTDTHPTKSPENRILDVLIDKVRTEGQNYGINSVTYSENVPGSYFPNQFGVVPEGAPEGARIEMVITRSVDEKFIDTYEMTIADGRNFTKTLVTDRTEAALINETAAKMFGWDDPVGKRFRFAFDQNYFTVIGVVQDIHFRSLQNKIEPLVFIQCWGSINFITARVHSDEVQASVAFLKQAWGELLPDFPFEYHFVDDMYRASYVEEEKLMQIITIFAVFAIVLAALGLLGLSALMAVQRTKEIGIRKVLGASIANILIILSKKFAVWVVIANFVALPIAGYVMKYWLQNFPYRIDLSWWMFALAGGLALIIALGTVSWQALRAAMANPVEALRYE